MEISYANDDVEELCTSEKKATRKLGPDGAKKLRLRLDDLEAAPTLAALPPVGGLHTLKGSRAGQFAMDLDRGRRLVSERAGTGSAGVRILWIGDYHD